jgi:hypothetical protein
MAGLSGQQVIIDVREAARKLIPPPEPAGVTEAAESAERLIEAEHLAGPQKCPLGHDQPSGVRFCGQCGLDMSAPPPGQASLEDARPRPAESLTPAERAERDRQHLEAIAAAAQFEHQPQVFEQYEPKPGETIVIHFVEDGLTAFGKVWYRGEEIEMGPDHPRWQDARGWILLDKWQQYDRYGKQFFDRGPWPGQRGFTGASFERLASGKDSEGRPTGWFAGPSEEELRQAEQAALRRGRSVPASAFR